MVTVIGEVENKEIYIREISRILKPDGVLSISELAGAPDKMTVRELNELLSANGFKLKNRFGSDKNYTLNFIKS